jgi:hypothetical protein
MVRLIASCGGRRKHLEGRTARQEIEQRLRESLAGMPDGRWRGGTMGRRHIFCGPGGSLQATLRNSEIGIAAAARPYYDGQAGAL